MAEDNTYILLNDGISKLHILPKNPDLFFHKTTLIFGAANSGKSTILEEILFLLKDKIPTIFVFSPTNSSNNAFTGKIPDFCIKNDLDIDWLDTFVSNQKNLTEVATISNKLDILRSLFLRIADNNEKYIINDIIHRAEEHCIAIDSNSALTHNKKINQKKVIRLQQEDTMRKIYKHVIRQHKDHIDINQLTRLERTALTYIDLKPDAILVFDDCASQFKHWFKKTTKFKEIFYNVRHMSLSVIITSQDDKEVDSELRKNTMVTFFTTDQSAAANFERASNSYPKHLKEYSRKAIKTVFHQESGEPKHYQKLCYIRGDQDPFRYIIADIHDNFKFGSKALWKVQEYIKKDDNNSHINNHNPYLK